MNGNVQNKKAIPSKYRVIYHVLRIIILLLTAIIVMVMAGMISNQIGHEKVVKWCSIVAILAVTEIISYFIRKHYMKKAVHQE